MYIDFLDLVPGFEESPKPLTYVELEAAKQELIQVLMAADLDYGLIHMVRDLIDQAREAGYHGGYSDAHWYAKGMGDGA